MDLSSKAGHGGQPPGGRCLCYRALTLESGGFWACRPCKHRTRTTSETQIDALSCKSENLKYGDLNTQWFHSRANMRRARNYIDHLGSRWLAGDGCSIEAWNSRWLPKPSTFKVITYKPSSLPDSFVHDLINYDNVCWHVGLVRDYFLPIDADVILAMPFLFGIPYDYEEQALECWGLVHSADCMENDLEPLLTTRYQALCLENM
ncbi:hypothetical protein Cgig2_017490 [Carnegiea gigantea]|uniref:Uncharacterized protein n=1 Tax=Carnegiea gigantea TaxID=171969 RepID=A0A9Q1KMH8_9CARY|nr:hypothetical protein Cgig2_017490 [Carnegiea gigantea]